MPSSQIISLAVTCLLLAGCGGGEFPDDRGFHSKALVTTVFTDEFHAVDNSRWLAADWSNGGYFLNRWSPQQLSFADGRLTITLEADRADATGRSCVSGEYRSVDTYGHGTFSTRMVASRTPGTITAFFLYTGPHEGTRHDEIDMEIKGDDPTKLAINYWSDGIEQPTVVDLGFDASAGWHDYAFRWTPAALQWFVDGRLVHEETGTRGPLPQVPGHIMLSHWGATGAEPWSTSYQVGTPPSRAQFERVTYQPEPLQAPTKGKTGSSPRAGRR